MQHVLNGYRGMTLLVNLNGDRLLYLATIAAALWAGAFVGSL
ncbi:MAG: hypothetical protein ACE369_17290 [Roseovarius sp.]